MPRKDLIRQFCEGGCYHVYSRGNNKNAIFLEPRDYEYFFELIDFYLSSPHARRTQKNFYGQIEIFAFCLMPNHFHFLLRQQKMNSMARFLHCLNMAYVRYFNKKYQRVGRLFQSAYNARLISSDADLLNLTKYIHRNPIDIYGHLEKYPYSSLQYYGSSKNIPIWLNMCEVLSIFSNLFILDEEAAKRKYEQYIRQG